MLNADGRKSPGYAFPGEEAVPPEFRPRKLPAAAAGAWSVLFGKNPDRLLMNYRLAEYLNLLHATDLAGYVTGLDPRITYTPGRAIPGSAFEPSVEGSTAPIYFFGDPSPDDALGRLVRSWRIETLSGNRASVRRETSPISDRIVDLSPAAGLSGAVALDEKGGFSCAFDPTPGNVWYVTAASRPSRGLPEVVSALRRSGFASDELFAGGEPYKTFENLWKNHPDLGYRLAGVLLAVGYRADDAGQGLASARTATVAGLGGGENDPMDAAQLRIVPMRPSTADAPASGFPFDFGTPTGRKDMFVAEVGDATDLSMLVVGLDESDNPSSGWTPVFVTLMPGIATPVYVEAPPYTRTVSDGGPVSDDEILDGRVRMSSGNSIRYGTFVRTKRYLRHAFVSVNVEAAIVSGSRVVYSPAWIG